MHIFPSQTFFDCDLISGFARVADNNSTIEQTENNHKEIEVSFKKNEKPSVAIIPNPNTGIFTLEIYNAENLFAIISIKSPFGNEIKKFNTTEHKISLDLHILSKGIYFVEVMIENNKIVKKLVIQ